MTEETPVISPVVSQSVKTITWGFYADAMSGDPTIAIPGCKNLVSTLISSVILLNAVEYEKVLEKCYVWANRAHYLYYKEQDVFAAMEYCNNITLNLTPMINDPAGRFSTIKTESFRYSEGGKR